MPWKMPRTTPHSKWPLQLISNHNRPSNENWCFSWQARCGGEASAIEARLFNIGARELLGRRRHFKKTRRVAKMTRGPPLHGHIQDFDDNSPTTPGLDDQSDAVTRSFSQLTGLPTSPLDRLSRHEATLRRQACQILWTLPCLDRHKPWEKRRPSHNQF